MGDGGGDGEAAASCPQGETEALVPPNAVPGRRNDAGMSPATSQWTHRPGRPGGAGGRRRCEGPAGAGEKLRVCVARWGALTATSSFPPNAALARAAQRRPRRRQEASRRPRRPMRAAAGGRPQGTGARGPRKVCGSDTEAAVSRGASLCRSPRTQTPTHQARQHAVRRPHGQHHQVVSGHGWGGGSKKRRGAGACGAPLALSLSVSQQPWFPREARTSLVHARCARAPVLRFERVLAPAGVEGTTV